MRVASGEWRVASGEWRVAPSPVDGKLDKPAEGQDHQRPHPSMLICKAEHGRIGWLLAQMPELMVSAVSMAWDRDRQERLL